jgi:hypothetical protein
MCSILSVVTGTKVQVYVKFLPWQVESVCICKFRHTILVEMPLPLHIPFLVLVDILASCNGEAQTNPYPAPIPGASAETRFTNLVLACIIIYCSEANAKPMAYQPTQKRITSGSALRFIVYTQWTKGE